MITYLARLNDGSQIDAVRINDHYESLDGAVIEPISLVSFDLITRSQYEFECLYRQFTTYGDYSKHDTLKYRDSRTNAAYSVFRVSNGLPVIDPDYKSIGQTDVVVRPASVYSNAKYKGD